MTLPGLLVARVLDGWTATIAKNVQDRFRTVYAGLELNPDPAVIGCPVYKHPGTPPWDEVSELGRRIAREHGITHAILLTPLHDWSEALRVGLADHGVQIVWAEVFPGLKLLLDRAGAQYTHDNDIYRHAAAFPVVSADTMIGTRFAQPKMRMPKAVRFAADVEDGEEPVVVFGQVDSDNALKDTKDVLPYAEWLDALFTRNPETTFLFKHHPAKRTPGIEKYPNVSTVDENLYSLFLTFQKFAAYNSTVILEGTIQGKVFATGSFHFTDHPAIHLQIRRAEDAENLEQKLGAFQRDPGETARRLGFITRAYALKPNDPYVGDRLTLPSGEYFAKIGRELGGKDGNAEA